MKKNLIVLIAASLLCGCASTGNNFDSRKISDIKKGETTKDQLIQMFGQPAQRGMNSEGGTTMVWMYTEATIKGATFVPIVGLFAGGADTKNKMLTVRLNSTNTVASYDYTGGAMDVSNGTQNDPEDSTNHPALKTPRGH